MNENVKSKEVKEREYLRYFEIKRKKLKLQRKKLDNKINVC